MIFISHRGNLNGVCEAENDPNRIVFVLNAGYEVEIDVWYINKSFFLGHDKPQYLITSEFFNNNFKLWCHAKTIPTLYQLLLYNCICFFHQNDEATLTSHGVIWTFPGKTLTPNSICVLPDRRMYNFNCLGICSDYIEIFKRRSGND